MDKVRLVLEETFQSDNAQQRAEKIQALVEQYLEESLASAEALAGVNLEEMP